MYIKYIQYFIKQSHLHKAVSNKTGASQFWVVILSPNSQNIIDFPLLSHLSNSTFSWKGTAMKSNNNETQFLEGCALLERQLTALLRSWARKGHLMMVCCPCSDAALFLIAISLTWLTKHRHARGSTCDNQNNLTEKGNHYLQTAWSGLCELGKRVTMTQKLSDQIGLS